MQCVVGYVVQCVVGYVVQCVVVYVVQCGMCVAVCGEVSDMAVPHQTTQREC